VIGATAHNLRDLSVAIPLRRLVCLTGVSGSGKTTLLREILLPALEKEMAARSPVPSVAAREPEETGEVPAAPSTAAGRIAGAEHLDAVVLVDQAALGKTPRSNPAVYLGAFDDVRELFAQTDAARQRGLNASAFSFNSAQGQCERCRGAGFEKIEMQFLSDVFIRCPDCNGRRYRPHILEVKVAVPGARTAWSVADLLAATVDEVMAFLAGFPDSQPAARARRALSLLQEVGLGYLRAGQPINTLSGGESQRLKLVSHLADSAAATGAQRATLFLFDEPTTGLHFDDIRVLLQVFQRLVNAGHSVLVIEHNLEVIKCADWVIDLGPDAGDEGGRVVVTGTPERVAACAASHTGAALRVLGFR
jgi:excinuclease ABC subunit A